MHVVLSLGPFLDKHWRHLHHCRHRHRRALGRRGAATSAHLDLPTGVALDSSGNLYIADQYNNRVQFVAAAACSSSCRWGLSSTTAHDIYTIAGSSSGTEGHSGDGSAATSALLNDPGSVALDAAGNLYIADTDNNRVQFVAATACTSSCPLGLSSTTANDIYTIAGSASGSSGDSGNGGAATSALLLSPSGLALNSAGDVFVADGGNNRVQLVAAAACSSLCPLGISATTKGDIYTVAGSATGADGESGLGGIATSAVLNGVAGVGTDPAGDLYLADTYNYEVDEVPTTASGSVTSSYSYNGDGLEASRTAVGVLSQLTWGEIAGSGLPVVFSDSANDYVYGPSGTPVEQVALATSTPTYLTYTPSDSSWLSTNQAGDETGFWRYDAFGTLAFGSPTSPFGYSGQYTDASTGFVNDRARWYQAQTGEFTTRDPAFASTDTAYTYAGDDPVNEKDPTGLTWGFTYGVCGNAEAEIGFGIGGVGAQGQPCALHTNRSDLTSQDGVSFTVGVTFLNLGGGAALSAYFLVSNASSISQMRGPFAAVAASVFGWGGAVFWGLDNSGSPNGVFGFEGGPGIGPEADIGFWMQYSWTYTVPTWISRVVSLVSGNPITAFADSNGFGVDRRRELLAEAQHQLAEDQAKYAGRTNLGGCPEPG